jgi:hypothetical protein
MLLTLANQVIVSHVPLFVHVSGRCTSAPIPAWLPDYLMVAVK